MWRIQKGPVLFIRLLQHPALALAASSVQRGGVQQADQPEVQRHGMLMISAAYFSLCGTSCCKTWVISPQKRTSLSAAAQWPKQLNASLEEVDPELYDIIEKEKNRQFKVCSRKA